MEIYKLLYAVILLSLEVNCENDCGLKDTEPSNGIEEVHKGDWPWAVAFKSRDFDIFLGSGSLITARFVISVAHIFHRKFNAKPRDPKTVICLTDKIFLDTDKKEDYHQTLTVLHIVIHSDWDPYSEKFKGDISFVVLGQSVLTSASVCLPRNKEIATGTGSLIGWGISPNSQEEHAEVSRKLSVPIMKSEDCFQIATDLSMHFSKKMFCGGSLNSQGPCKGDNGAGLYFQTPDSQGRLSWKLFGMALVTFSGFRDNCQNGKISLFTNVAEYVDWIEEMKKKHKSTMEVVELKCDDKEYENNTLHYETCSSRKTLPSFSHIPKRVQFRISRGEDLKKNEFPWIVKIIQVSDQTFLCGGSLITEKHVLTAAHCSHLKGFNVQRFPHEIYCETRNFLRTIVTKSGVLEIINHPSWDPFSTNYTGDISILLLDKTVKMPLVLIPVNMLLSRNGTVVGWGMTENLEKPYSDDPKKLDVEIVTDEVCFESEELEKIAVEHAFCAGYRDQEKGVCPGDSGSGLYTFIGNKWFIEGIVSTTTAVSGATCNPDEFAFYTRVTDYAGWIGEVIEKTERMIEEFRNFGCEHQAELTCNPPFDSSFTQSQDDPSGLLVFGPFTTHGLTERTEKLKIDIGNFFEIPHEWSRNFPRLKFLRVKAFDLNSVRKKSLIGLNHLERLDLSNTIILHLDESDAFEHLPNLLQLEMRRCKIEKLPINMLHKLVKLEILNLYGNLIKEVPKRFFRKSRMLREIILQRNQITSIGADFSILKNIEIINLIDNHCIQQKYSSDGELTLEAFQNLVSQNCSGV